MDISGIISGNRKSLRAGFLVLLVAFVATLPLYAGAYQVIILASIFGYAVLAVSWAMFSSATGYMSLAPAAFFGVGIYAMVFLQNRLPFPVIIVMGGLVAFAFALLIGLVTLRLKGMYFAIFTFGLVVFMSELIRYLEVNLWGTHGRAIIPLSLTTLFYWMLGLLVVTLFAIYFINRSRWGLAMQSIGGNEEAAAHMGVNTTMVKVLTFAISAIFMGAAGVITGPVMIYINPSIAFSLSYTFLPILMAVFGGMGQLYGPVLGAVVFGYLEKILRAQLYSYFMLGFGIMLVVVILFLPNGIAGLVPMLQGKLGGLLQKLRKGGQAEQHGNT